MAHFFFDFRTESGVDRDEVGIGLADFEAAYLEAYRGVLDIFAEARREGRNPNVIGVEVRDANGRILLDLPISEVLGGRAETRRNLLPKARAVDPKHGLPGRHLDWGEQQIADQVARIRRLEAKGCDVILGHRLLATMLQTQALRQHHFYMLRRA